MDEPVNKPELEEPDDREIEREVAEEQEAKYGGRDRWFLTGASLLLLPLIGWAIHERNPLVLLYVALLFLCGSWAGINWYHWWKKTPAQRAAAPAPEITGALRMVEHPAPYTRDEFIHARSAFGVNLMLGFLPGLLAVAALLLALAPRQMPAERIVAAVFALGLGGVSWFFGKRGMRQARYLACPGCRDTLTSQFKSVMETGRCRKCGSVVLSDSARTPTQPEATTRPPVTGTRRRTASRRVATLRPGFKHDRKRLLDIVVLFACPAICFLVSSGWKSGSGLLAIIGVLLAGYGACLYFFPDRDAEEESDQFAEVPARKEPVGGAGNNTKAIRAPWLDFAMILLVPVTVVGWMLYLVWTHTVLGWQGLAVVTVAIPAAVVLMSWFVVRHVGHHVKQTGKPAPAALMAGLLLFWCAAVFVFVVCLVSLIQKFGLQW